MGKTRQRFVSAYSLGRQDAKEGRPFRWEKHPLIMAYREGYHSVKKAKRR